MKYSKQYDNLISAIGSDYTFVCITDENRLIGGKKEVGGVEEFVVKEPVYCVARV